MPRPTREPSGQAVTPFSSMTERAQTGKDSGRKRIESSKRKTKRRAPAGAPPVSERLVRSKATRTPRAVAPSGVTVAASASMFRGPGTSGSYGRCGPPGAGSGGGPYAAAPAGAVNAPSSNAAAATTGVARRPCLVDSRVMRLSVRPWALGPGHLLMLTRRAVPSVCSTLPGVWRTQEPRAPGRTMNSMRKQGELGDFLRSRRARIRPEDVGFASGSGQRRVPGLRREELAHLAGVSVDYYKRLEQGRNHSVSDAVLGAVADALRLDQDERDHLFRLARPRKAVTGTPGGDGARPEIQRLLDWISAPALVMGRRMDVLAWNRPVCGLITDFGRLPPPERNLTRLHLLEPDDRQTLSRSRHGRPRGRGAAADRGRRLPRRSRAVGAGR
ncbi:helix-turn-helix domain-containing protein [Streptomyces scopuliridis]|uniref:MmyB family transcriptional regulator n=1 Tax=Streptomyces scopuliridis TaxID=452529 RepID=UPI002DDB2643|nr:helix-turn-helix domain-containing protein [Streptomyces scopuliridis]